MNKGDIMWKCQKCDRLINNHIFESGLGWRQCVCGEWYWSFNKFIIDKDDEIKVNIESLIDKTPDILTEKAYRDGYSRGFEEGDTIGYSDGFDDGYDKGRGVI